jgi:glycosyltransferase involved in cell wall biosynthesis
MDKTRVRRIEKNKPVVSVVIPTYNRVLMLDRAIQSVLNQTLKNIELIVVDDASKDNSWKFLKSNYSDSRMVLIQHDRNLGGAAARNTGIRNARGEYIAFLDSDDEWLPEKLEVQLSCIQSDPTLGAVYCKHVAVDYKGKSYAAASKHYYRGWVRDKLVRGWCPVSSSLFLVRKQCFQKVGLFDESLPSYQDYDFWLRLSPQFRFDYVPEILAKFHHHTQSRVSINLDARINGFEIFMEKWESDFREELGGREFEKLRREFLGRIYNQVASQSAHNKNRWSGAKFLVNAIKYTPLDYKLYIRLLILLLGGQRLYNSIASIRREHLVS